MTIEERANRMTDIRGSASHIGSEPVANTRGINGPATINVSSSVKKHALLFQPRGEM